VYFWNLLHRPKRTGVRLRMDGEMAGKNFEAVDHVTWTRPVKRKKMKFKYG